MIRQLLIGGATATLLTGSASALTMNVLEDDRVIFAEANAGFDSDSNSDIPTDPEFNSSVNASAASINQVLTGGIGGGAGGIGFNGAVANASAGQTSEVNYPGLSITGSGFANASGNHGNPEIVAGFGADGSGGGGGLDFNSFRAQGVSTLEVLFSIDEAASFDLSGFLSAGNELASGPIGNDISNSAIASLRNNDTNASVFKTEINNGSTILDESGVIGPGTYSFLVEAFASVNGFGGFSCIDCGTFTVAPIDIGGYATSAGFKGVALNLEAIDKPIPEPVTTTLAAMGLGALVLRTSRRRHH